MIQAARKLLERICVYWRWRGARAQIPAPDPSTSDDPDAAFVLLLLWRHPPARRHPWDLSDDERRQLWEVRERAKLYTSAKTGQEDPA